MTTQAATPHFEFFDLEPLSRLQPVAPVRSNEHRQLTLGTTALQRLMATTGDAAFAPRHRSRPAAAAINGHAPSDDDLKFSDLNEREAQLQHREARLVAAQARLRTAHAEATHKLAEHAARLKRTGEARAREFAARDAEQARRNQRLHEEAVRLAQRDAELKQRQAMLAEREAALQLNGHSLVQQFEQLNNARQHLQAISDSLGLRPSDS